MCEKERSVLEKLSESIPKLSPMQKVYFSGIAEGMAIAQQMQEETAKEAKAEAPVVTI